MQALKNIVINGAMTLALLFGLTVSAQASYSYCVNLSQLARTTMSAYQTGVSYEALMETATIPIIADIIDDAFTYRRYMSEPYRQQTINDFALGYFASCLDDM